MLGCLQGEGVVGCDWHPGILFGEYNETLEQACPLLSGLTYRSYLRLTPVIQPSTCTGREQTCSNETLVKHTLSLLLTH